MKSEYETMHAERDLALQQLTAVYRSRSYRLTGPLRMIADLFRRMAARL